MVSRWVWHHWAPFHVSWAPFCVSWAPFRVSWAPFRISWAPFQASLEDVVGQFEQELCKYQRFWDTMDQLDRDTLVLEPERPSRDNTQRRIMIGQSEILEGVP